VILYKISSGHEVGSGEKHSPLGKKAKRRNYPPYP
jgi:hypothetical protein